MEKKEKGVVRSQLAGFMTFVREQGVVGLATGFILGGSVAKVVSSLVEDIINPLLGLVLGSSDNLTQASLKIGGSEIMWGSFLSVMIDFTVIAMVVYFGIKGLGLDKLDKKKGK